MTTFDERIARQEAKAGVLTANRAPQTSAEGARMNTVAAQPTPPIRDVPIQGQLPGDDAFNAPLDEQMLQQQNEAAQARLTFPDRESAQKAVEILRANADTWEPERLAAGWDRVKQFVSDNPAPEPVVAIDEPTTGSLIDTSSLPTGVERIDRAGQTVTRGGSGMIPAFSQAIPSMDDLPFDHPLVLRKQAADEGVDMISGVNFGSRANVARSPEIERLRSGAIQRTMQGMFSEIPEELPKLRYDLALGEFQVMRPQGDGKYRWTSMDGTGLELGDIGDMFNPAEILSLAGSIFGIGKVTKGIEFGTTAWARSKVAAGGFAGGLGGRVLGDGISIITNGLESDQWPTWKELTDRGWKDVQVEAFATLVGEIGGAIVRKGGDILQDAAINASGHQGVKRTDLGTPDRVRIEDINDNIRAARKDLETVQDVTGREDFSVTRGQAWRSIDVLAEETHARANASASTREAFRRADAANRQITDEYINKTFKTTEREALENKYGVIVAANDVINSAGTTSVLKTESGELIFLPKLLDEGLPPEAVTQGLKINPKVDGWHVVGAKLPDELLDTGIGKSLYIAASEEAGRHGKVLVSDSALSGDAIRMWESLAKGGEIGPVVKHTGEIVERAADGQGRVWKDTVDGSPMFRVKESPAIVPLLLREEIDPITGRVISKNEFRRFLRTPGRKEMAQAVEEVNANPFVLQDIKQAVLEDFTNVVGKGNKFNKESYAEWREQVLPNLDNFFTPREMLSIRSGPNGLRQAVDAGKSTTTAQRNALSSVLGVKPNSSVLKDNKAIWNQMKNMESKKRGRIMRLLDQGKQGDNIRALFKEDLKDDLLIKANGANYKGFNKWLRQNRELIQDMLGAPMQRGPAGMQARATTTKYLQDLELVGRVLRQRSESGMVRGTATEANPTSLALFRVVFGPLSRAQRFLSGARRGSIRWNAAQASDIIMDPAKLKTLIEIKGLQLSSRAVARVAHSLDLAPQFGMDDFDPDSQEDRDEFAMRINAILQGELDENVE